MRRTKLPSACFATSQEKSAVRALPTWIEPLGAGSMRVRIRGWLTPPMLSAGSTDVVEPLRVLLVLASDDREVLRLDLLGDRAGWSDDAAVDLAHRSHFGRRSAAEQLISKVEVGARDHHLAHGRAEVGRD